MLKVVFEEIPNKYNWKHGLKVLKAIKIYEIENAQKSRPSLLSSSSSRALLEWEAWAL